ncbi:MAG: hypothetical protein AB7J35_19620 [Dehalococcoidia bacterium]
MKTQAELRAEYDRLFEAEDYEAAGRILDLIEPISDQEWHAILDSAPIDDEPVPEFIRERFETLKAVLAAAAAREAG